LRCAAQNLIPEVGTDGEFGDHVDFSSKEVFQVLFDSDEIQKMPARLEVDEEVEIAIWTRRSSGE
jgi:hypothetical protein